MTSTNNTQDCAHSVADIEREIATWLKSEASTKAALRSQALAEAWAAQLLAERLRQATLTPDTLADRIGTSEHALRDRLTNLGAKFSVGEMILHGRLELAARLLTNRLASTSIIDIAQACGWDDPRRFAVVFKALWGVTPKEFQAASATGLVRAVIYPNPNGLLTDHQKEPE